MNIPGTLLPAYDQSILFSANCLSQQTFYKRGILIIVLLLTVVCATARQVDTSRRLSDPATAKTTAPDNDTANPGFVKRAQKYGQELEQKYADKFTSEKIALSQEKVLEASKKTMEKAKIYLRNGMDTGIIGAELRDIKEWSEIAGDGIFTNKGSAQSYRNLATSYNLILVLQKRATNIKAVLDRHHSNLINFRYQMDSLSTDPSIFKFPADSASLVNYIKKIATVSHGVGPVDSLLKVAIASVEEIQNPVNAEVFDLTARLEEIEGNQRYISDRTFKREFPALLESVGYSRPFSEISYYSKKKGLLTLRFYAEANAVRITIVLLFIIIVAAYLGSLKRICKAHNLLSADFNGQLVLRYPVLSALVIIPCLFQFIFVAPPFIFTATCWVISSIALTIIFRNFISRFWMFFWLATVILFFAACADNLLLQASRIERWCMLVLALAGVIVGMFTLAKGNRHELKEKWIVYAIGLMVVLEFAAIVANLSGRYNFSKILLTSGFFNVLIAILFLWTIRLINEALSLAYTVYSGSEKRLLYINYQKIGTKAHPLFYTLLLLGWLILFGRNFYAFKLMTDPFRAFLAQERNIGDYTFTINNLLILFFIIAISIVISKLVSFFASDRRLGSVPNQKDERAGLGSWLLLIRISIITLGVLFAFAAAGIPMDKIAIILGALGVGIGFGLQTLVNNLVSGLIIAFEKPVNVGDIVEINGQTGAMKSIGFRSSIIATWDGADMVIPNGDLLNSRLLNWTLGGNKRRITLVVGVSYNTDLEKAKSILMEILNAEERILRNPEPVVLFQDFKDSSIDVTLFFWVRHLRDGSGTKSDVIAAITTAFRKNQIDIPFPQQDVHIYKTNDEPDLPRVK